MSRAVGLPRHLKGTGYVCSGVVSSSEDRCDGVPEPVCPSQAGQQDHSSGPTASPASPDPRLHLLGCIQLSRYSKGDTFE